VTVFGISPTLSSAAVKGRLQESDLNGELQAWIEVEPGDRPLDLAYAAAAGPWVEAGYVAHYVVVPARDAEQLEAWFALGFGKQQCYAALELGPRPAIVPRGFTIRLCGQDDFEASLALGDLIREAHFRPPVWSGVPPRPPDELRRLWAEAFAEENDTSFLAVRDGEVIGEFLLTPRDHGEIYLAYAVVRPDARRLGVGVALTETALAWAHEQGFRSCTTDWRTANPLASRFWPNRGFVPTSFRLHRLVRPTAR
jgi:GNAT superfamily N-acetyltransferase